MAAEDQEPILQFFAYEYLRPDVQSFLAPFAQLAHGIVDSLPRNPERTVALRKLLESRDAALRAFRYMPPITDTGST